MLSVIPEDAPLRNGNAVSHGLYRKYLPQEIYDLKELTEAVNNDF